MEPFFGGGGILLGRPTPFDGIETINDADGFLCNFWRAVQADPESVADHADWPVNENDLHARHAWLVGLRAAFVPRMEGDPNFFDAKIAGWWVWGIACWIGSGWCSGKGPWRSVEQEDGSRHLVHLGNAGQGVNRQRVHLGNAGQGVNRQLIHLGNAGQGVNRKRDDHRAALFTYMQALSDRLRHVRVCCGDWTRVMGPTPMFPTGRSSKSYRVGVALDPPYADIAERQAELYAVDSLSVAHSVRRWAIEHGDDPRYRIALCGYDGEHEMPADWNCIEGKAGRGHGYGGQSVNGYTNAERERIWFSPHCLVPNVKRRIPSLFDGLDDDS